MAPLDLVGGLVLGAAAGVAAVWMAGAVLLHVPGQFELRRAVQQSEVLARLNEVVPPARLLDAIQRVDPFPAIVGPAGPSEPPDPALLRQPAVRQAAPSVVRVLGTACGLGVSGTGWVAAPELVVTAAHVVAGQQDTIVEHPGSGDRLRAQAVAFDSRNDVAVLRVDGLRGRALRFGDGADGQAVVILGYPENGPFTAVAGRARPHRRRDLTGRVRSRAGEPDVTAPVGLGATRQLRRSRRGRERHVETTVFASRASVPTAASASRTRSSATSCLGTHAGLDRRLRELDRQRRLVDRERPSVRVDGRLDAERQRREARPMAQRQPVQHRDAEPAEPALEHVLERLRAR